MIIVILSYAQVVPPTHTVAHDANVLYNNIIYDALTDVHRMRYIFVRVAEYGHFEAVVRPFYRRLGDFQRLQVIFFAGAAHGRERQTRDYDFGQHLDEEANRIETSDCVL